MKDDFTRSLAAYRLADVALVNPVRDGMNLVAKEIPVVSEEGCALVLSREAGAYEELGEDALTVNPSTSRRPPRPSTRPSRCPLRTRRPHQAPGDGVHGPAAAALVPEPTGGAEGSRVGRHRTGDRTKKSRARAGAPENARMTDLDFYAHVATRGDVLGAGISDPPEAWEAALGSDCLDDVSHGLMRRDYGLVELSFEEADGAWSCFGISVRIHRLSTGDASMVPPPLRNAYGSFAPA